MTRARRALGPTVLTAAALLVALPAAAFADGDHGRGHRKWKTRERIIYVAPAPVVVLPPPVVVAPPPAYVWVPGHYQAHEEVRYVPGPAASVWVPPQLGARWLDDRLVQVVLSPGHYESRPGPLVPVKEVVQVWVPGRWVPAAEAVAFRRRGD